MHVVSVNVGLPRNVAWKGMTVHTGIFKEPVDGRVSITKLNLAGDQQADLTVHGGAAKAVYAYPAEHYEYWRKKLPEVSFSWGKFGENLNDCRINGGGVVHWGSTKNRDCCSDGDPAPNALLQIGSTFRPRRHHQEFLDQPAKRLLLLGRRGRSGPGGIRG